MILKRYKLNKLYLSLIFGLTFLPIISSNATTKIEKWDGFAQAGDTRKVRDQNSPKWLEAVGRLIVAKRTLCTITLVSDGESDFSRVAITNSHCIDELYRYGKKDLEKITDVTFTSKSDQKVHIKVSDIIVDGGFNYSQVQTEDYAILILNRLIHKSEIQPLFYNGEDVDDIRDYFFDSEFDNDPEIAKARITYKETIAGYSADKNKNLGNSGKNLTYDDNCFAKPMNFDEDESNYIHGYLHKVYNCYSYKGSSGGAYVVSYFDPEEENDNGTRGKEVAILIGINAAVNHEELIDNKFDYSTSIVVTIGDFIDDLDAVVAIYNISKQ